MYSSVYWGVKCQNLQGKILTSKSLPRISRKSKNDFFVRCGSFYSKKDFVLNINFVLMIMRASIKAHETTAISFVSLLPNSFNSDFKRSFFQIYAARGIWVCFGLPTPNMSNPVKESLGDLSQPNTHLIVYVPCQNGKYTFIFLSLYSHPALA